MQPTMYGEYSVYRCFDQEQITIEMIKRFFESLGYQKSHDRESYKEHYEKIEFIINEKHILGKDVDLRSQLQQDGFKINMSPRNQKENPVMVMFEECISIEIDDGSVNVYCLLKNGKIQRLSELKNAAMSQPVYFPKRIISNLNDISGNVRGVLSGNSK